MLIKICKICLQFPGEKENKRLSIKKKSAKSWGIFFELFHSLWRCLRDVQWSQRSQGSHRPEEYLNSRGSPWKVLKFLQLWMKWSRKRINCTEFGVLFLCDAALNSSGLKAARKRKWDEKKSKCVLKFQILVKIKVNSRCSCSCFVYFYQSSMLSWLPRQKRNAGKVFFNAFWLSKTGMQE